MVGDANDVDLLDVDVVHLIADARVLQRHLAESGKLADTSLGEAIGALTRARGTPEAAKALATLSVEFSKAIKLAENASIEKLRKESARAYRNRWMDIREGVTASFAIVLICLAVLGFVIVQDLNDNIAELQRINLQNPLQKLTELRRIIDEGALNDPKSAYYLQYLRAHNEVALMFDSANQILERTAASSQRRARNDAVEYASIASDSDTGITSQIYNIILFELIGPATRTTGPISASASKSASAPMSASASISAPAHMTRQAKAANSAASLAGKNGIAESIPRSPLDLVSSEGGTIDGIYTPVPRIDERNCKPYDNAPIKKLIGVENKQFLQAALDKFDDFCLAQTLDIRIGSYRPASAIHTVRVLQDQLFTIGVLFLPLVGGLLGATISIIYAIINNNRTAQLSAGYMAVRIVVGGAFGVIIGWFSAGGSSGSADFIPRVSGTPFTLAILAGFSVQSLSAVLMTFSSVLEKQKGAAKSSKSFPDIPVSEASPDRSGIGYERAD
jgi:hypothetical protein